MTKGRALEVLDVGLEREGFLLDIVREIAGTLEDVVGEEEASGFISVVGQRLGEKIGTAYIDAQGRAALSIFSPRTSRGCWST